MFWFIIFIWTSGETYFLLPKLYPRKHFLVDMNSWFLLSFGIRAHSLTRALHTQEQEHVDDGQECSDRIRDDELKGIVVGDEEDVEDGCGRQVAGQKAAGIGQDGAGFDHVQAEESDRPNAMENLEWSRMKKLVSLIDINTVEFNSAKLEK